MTTFDWHVGRLRAMGRHALADELDGRFPCPSRPLEAIRRSGPDAPPRDTVEALEAPQNATGDPPRTSG